ncbi:hypothetical protein [Cupriavidus pinatubonensis]|uniref:hypothetical protein n=1 Tax=Cupriavidus pinatubonensis TaxID=248026 RepID=UPI00112A19C2|nr:hypothetical protein [Cupriavidus pinatubonensis]
MALSLMPLIARLGAEPNVVALLTAICDRASRRKDGSMVADLSDIALAAMLRVPVRSVQRWKSEAREAGYISRGTRRGEIVVHLPSRRVLNDAVRDAYAQLGGNPNDAPTISDRWKESHDQSTPDDCGDATKPAKYGGFDWRRNRQIWRVLDGRKPPSGVVETAKYGGFENAPYIGFNKQQGKTVGAPNTDRNAAVCAAATPHRSSRARGWLARKGLLATSILASAWQPVNCLPAGSLPALQRVRVRGAKP